MRRAERALTWAVLAFCGAYALDARRIDIRLGQQISAAAFPLAAAVFTAISSGILLVTSRRTPADDAPADIGWTESSFAAMSFAYWLLIPWLGYVVATFMFLLAGTLLLGERPTLRPFLVSIGTTAAIWIVFQLLLGVPLPKAPLGLG